MNYRVKFSRREREEAKRRYERGWARWEIVILLLGMVIITLAVIFLVAIKHVKSIYNVEAEENQVPPTINISEYLNGEINGGEFQDAIARRISTFPMQVYPHAYQEIQSFIRQGKRPPKEVVKIEELLNYFNYNYPQTEGNHLLSAVTEVAEAPWNKNHLLIRIGLQAKRFEKERLNKKNNFVLLIDSYREKENIFEQALQSFIKNLTEKDIITIVFYPPRGLFLPTTKGSQKEKILAAIEELEEKKYCCVIKGIRLAYEVAKRNFINHGNNRIIWVSYEYNALKNKEIERIIDESRKRRIFISFLAIGRKKIKPSRLEELAERAKGNYAYLEKLEDAKIALANEIKGTPYPIAKNLKIQVEFNYKKVIAYRLIGYNHNRQQTPLYKSEFSSFSYNNTQGEDLGAGETVTVFYEIIPVGVAIDVNLPNLQTEKTRIEPDETSFYRPNELLRLRVQYQPFGQEETELIEEPVLDTGLTLKNASDDFKFSAAVAEFGLILRDDENKKNANLESVLQLATQSKGADLDGKRSEFIDLVKKSQRLLNSLP